MKRTLFLLNHRSGSHFMEGMLRGDIEGTFEPGGFDYRLKLPSPIWLKTDPPNQCLFYGVNYNPPVQNTIRVYKSQKDSPIPEAYTTHALFDDTTEQIDCLPPADWTVFFIYRDPRNRIASLLKRCLSHENHMPRQELFEMLAPRDQKIATGAIKMKKDPRFHYIDFDDLFDDPLKGLSKIYEIMGLSLDLPLYSRLIPEWNARHNSSYDDLGRERRHRWTSWSKEECKFVDKYVGDQLIELGYEKDHSWIKK